jgi:DNA-binding CsgD family transcriptional regulator/tetratricopeptide (TPR) repeat protein
MLASLRTDAKAELDGLDRMIDALRRDHVLTEVGVERLTYEQVAQVVEAILGQKPNERLLQSIQSMGEGVPFFVEELTPDPTKPKTLEMELPRAIRDNVVRQLDLLEINVRDVLLTASLLDGPIEADPLAHAFAVSPAAIQSIVTAAASSGLVVERHGSFVFRHALVRQVLSSLSSDSERQLRRQKLGEALAALYGESPAHAWQIATQFAQAGEPQQASLYALRAGNHALSVAATADARRAFQAASAWTTDDSERRRASEGLALVELREGNDAAAAQISRQVVNMLKQDGLVEEAAASLGRLSLVLTRAGDRENATAALDEALDLVDQLTMSKVAARLITQKANFLTFYLGRFEEASELMERAAEMASKLSERAVLAIAMDGKAEISSCRGEFSIAEKIGYDSLETAIESSDAEAIGRTHNNHAVRLVLHGRARAGMDVLNAGRKYIGDFYGSAGVASLDIARAWTHQMMGEPEPALELLQNLKSVWLGWRGLAAAIKTWAHIERGEMAEASILLRHAWQETGFEGWRDLSNQKDPMNPDVLELLAAEVQTQIALGSIPDAAGAAATYRALSTESGQPPEWARACALNARTLVLGKQTTRARSELLALKKLIEERPYPYWLADHAEISGLLAQTEGHDAAATEEFRRAASLYASCSNSLDQARCLRRASELLLPHGNHEPVKEMLSRAREIARSVGALAELSRTESLLRSIGVRPRAGRPRKTATTGALSAREEQIASLVAGGSTNTEIAKRLYLSEGTVAGYVTSALRKLELSSRAALAAWSAKAGLI